MDADARHRYKTRGKLVRQLPSGTESPRNRAQVEKIPKNKVEERKRKKKEKKKKKKQKRRKKTGKRKRKGNKKKKKKKKKRGKKKAN